VKNHRSRSYWLLDADFCKQTNRSRKASVSLSKKIFDRLVDGGASSPATTTPTRFYLKPMASGRKICKETIFLPGNGISLQKNRCGRAVHAAATDLILRSIEVF